MPEADERIRFQSYNDYDVEFDEPLHCPTCGTYALYGYVEVGDLGRIICAVCGLVHWIDPEDYSNIWLERPPH